MFITLLLFANTTSAQISLITVSNAPYTCASNNPTYDPYEINTDITYNVNVSPAVNVIAFVTNDRSRVKLHIQTQDGTSQISYQYVYMDYSTLLLTTPTDVSNSDVAILHDFSVANSTLEQVVVTCETGTGDVYLVHYEVDLSTSPITITYVMNTQVMTGAKDIKIDGYRGINNTDGSRFGESYTVGGTQIETQLGMWWGGTYLLYAMNPSPLPNSAGSGYYQSNSDIAVCYDDVSGELYSSISYLETNPSANFDTRTHVVGYDENYNQVFLLNGNGFDADNITSTGYLPSFPPRVCSPEEFNSNFSTNPPFAVAWTEVMYQNPYLTNHLNYVSHDGSNFITNTYMDLLATNGELSYNPAVSWAWNDGYLTWFTNSLNNTPSYGMVSTFVPISTSAWRFLDPNPDNCEIKGFPATNSTELNSKYVVAWRFEGEIRYHMLAILTVNTKPIGLSNTHEHQLSVSPNPSTDAIHISSSTSEPYDIVDTYGRCIYKGNTKLNAHVNTQMWPNSTYVIKTSSSHFTFSVQH